MIVERVAEVAAAPGLLRAQIAFAWSLSKPFVTAPVVGVTKPHHLDAVVATIDVELASEESARLEEPYVPHLVVGFG